MCVLRKSRLYHCKNNIRIIILFMMAMACEIFKRRVLTKCVSFKEYIKKYIYYVNKDNNI